jgi:protein O-GlcNAcase/histone acetyltransferase
MKSLCVKALQGCVEGWYGRLLDWPERHALMKAAASTGMNAWWYAPKEDIAHRFEWREPYSAEWRESFGHFCVSSQQHGMRVIAGMAPGIDFNFAHVSGGPDMQCLVGKTRHLLNDGAGVAALLLDDIDPMFSERSGSFASEGEAHATLANELGNQLGCALLVVPRIYANELHSEAPGYLPQFAKHLDDAHAIVHCGNDVVSRQVTLADCRKHMPGNSHRVIVWDNLYANDYCPRRLFVGAWRGRTDVEEYFLNPTGLLATDALLFDLVAAEKTSGPSEDAAHWRAVLDRHGVPASFDAIAYCFDAPVFNTSPAIAAGAAQTIVRPTLSDQLDALDELTWRWKSALAREWFPYLMSLRHDLLLEAGSLPVDRINKTQTPPLAQRLNGSSRTSGS